MDDLVRAVSFIWAVSFRNGALLSDKDLLKGDTVRPMASDLAAVWSDVVHAVETVLETALDRDLKYGQNGQYNSLNALNILWCWAFLARRWLSQNRQKVLAADAYEKSIAGCLDSRIDRWMVCSHWAGRWASSSGTVLAGYAKDLNQDCIAFDSATNAKSAIAISTVRIEALLDDIEDDAVVFAKSVNVDRREQVSRYNTLLWVWHRLNGERWNMSSIPLRSGRKKKCELEVDHTVAHGLWSKIVEALPPNNEDHQHELMQVINNLGNCTLLEKTFNISKSDRSSKKFLEEVHEIDAGKIKLVDWANALGLPSSLLDPTGATVEEIGDAIADRDDMMRSEIVEFIQGIRTRQDTKAAEFSDPASDE